MRALRSHLGIVISILLPWIGSLTAVGVVINHANAVQNLVGLELLLLGLLAVICISIGLLPNTLLIILGGVLFGWRFAGAMAFIYAFALLLGYEISRFWRPEEALEMLNGQSPKVRGLVARIRQKGFWVLFWGRMTPILPFMSMNMLYKSLNVSRPSFFVSGMLALQPRMFLLLWITQDLKTTEFYATAQQKALPYMLIMGAVSCGALLYQLGGKRQFLKNDEFNNE